MELGDKDIVTPGLSVAVPAIRQSQPFTVVITRVAETQLKVDQSIDYSIQYVDAPDLLRGQQQVQQAGREGNRELTYLVHRENGTETWRKLTDSTVTQAPVAEIIRRGTKVVDYGTGLASWYSGVGSLTAAHRTLPLGTRVRVVNTATGASVVVTIADRGPFVGGRIIDLSSDAFAAIASRGSGVVNVRLEKP
ncbi:G5 domain-containing protein [Patescibacteria group bacterium]|nr:G5 domain-containing protein [Patescibacteria group bacterium]